VPLMVLLRDETLLFDEIVNTDSWNTSQTGDDKHDNGEGMIDKVWARNPGTDRKNTGMTQMTEPSGQFRLIPVFRREH
jgi:hypothetical protein